MSTKIDAASMFLERREYELKSIADNFIVAMDTEGDYHIVKVVLTETLSENPNFDRREHEDALMSYVMENPDIEEAGIHMDVICITPIKDGKGILRHHLNVS